MQRTYKYFDLIVGLFVTVLLLSNLLSSAKIIDLGVSIGSLRLSFDAGTLVFPISYIFGDILTEIYGFRRSRRVIWIGFIASALMGFFVWLAANLPGESNWSSYAGQPAYDAILGGVSGLVVASLIAYWLGAFSNSIVIARMKVLTQGKYLWARTMSSTLVGQALDTLAFIAVATLLGVFPIDIFWSLVIANYLFKVGIELILTPITLPLINFLKKAEGEDVYDRDVVFTPFRLDA